MALQMALRLEKEASDLGARIDRAYRLAYGRAAEAAERTAALKHVEKMTAYHRRVPASPREPAKPVVHTITSELTGENFRFVQQPDPVVYEHNAHPSEVTPEVRALADLALVLMNSNEFVYIY
jgi:hypothetical protein